MARLPDNRAHRRARLFRRGAPDRLAAPSLLYLWREHVNLFDGTSVDWRSAGFETALALLAVAALLPIWIPKWLPLQDLPQHLAAIRVLADYGNPELRFTEYFRWTPFQTQYLGYYAAVWILSIGFEIDVANRLFLSICLAGTPYAMRYLLRRLRRPQFLVFFTFPLLYNTFLLLGFLNFIAAIPLMLVGLGLAANLAETFEATTAALLGAVAIVCFFMHVVPFAFLGLGAALLGVRGAALETFKRWLPLIPAGVISVAWTLVSPAGASTTRAMGESAEFRSWRAALRDAPDWLMNLTPHALDDQLLVCLGLLAVATLVAGAGVRRRRTDPPGETRASSIPPVRRVALLAPLALLCYFVLPTSYDWIWPISPRFGLIGLLLLIPALPAPREWPARILSTALVAVALAHFWHVGTQFRNFSSREVGELEEALDEIPPGRRVAGLIFDRGSAHVRFSPFLHYVAYYQARKGGAVMFTFADFPQSPYRFRDDNRPPEVRPRWEWTPGRVDPREDLKWYRYVLVRGGPGRIQRQRDTFDRLFDGRRWSVWRRKTNPSNETAD